MQIAALISSLNGGYKNYKKGKKFGRKIAGLSTFFVRPITAWNENVVSCRQSSLINPNQRERSFHSIAMSTLGGSFARFIASVVNLLSHESGPF